jgi:hypothetical protein
MLAYFVLGAMAILFSTSSNEHFYLLALLSVKIAPRAVPADSVASSVAVHIHLHVGLQVAEGAAGGRSHEEADYARSPSAARAVPLLPQFPRELSCTHNIQYYVLEVHHAFYVCVC